MKKKLLKNIIASYILTLALFALVAPSNLVFGAVTLQPPLSTNALVNSTVNINVATSPAQPNMILQFIPQDPNATINPFTLATCTTGSNGQCFATFKSSQLGVFKAKVWGYPSGAIPNPATDPSANFDITVVASSVLTATYNTTLQVGQSTPITAFTSNNKQGVKILFTTQTSGATFTPSSCSTGGYGSCSVAFNASKAGVFPIIINASGYTVGQLPPITVGTPPPSGLPGSSTSNYNFLAPLPDGSTGTPLKNIDVSGTGALSNYLNIILRLIIGLAAVLAVVTIVMGGVQYMTSELAHTKEEGKKKIYNAVMGLLLALGSWVLLNTINPTLLNTNINIDTTSIEYVGAPEGDSSLPPISRASSPATLAALQAMGISCPGTGGASQLTSIARSFTSNVTYDNYKRFTVDASVPTAYLDCSAFVSQVYVCAGLGNPGGNTTNIFASKIPITSSEINTLKVGDLVGWTAADYGTTMGHVLMYIGGGQFINTPGHNGVNNAVKLSGWSPKIKWVSKAP